MVFRWNIEHYRICLDRHLSTRHSKDILWEGDNPDDVQTLHTNNYDEVCQLSNASKLLVYKKATVLLYRNDSTSGCRDVGLCKWCCSFCCLWWFQCPRPARPHFLDCEAKIILTQDSVYRGNRKIPLSVTMLATNNAKISSLIFCLQTQQ